MHVYKWWIVCLVLYHSVDSKTTGKIQAFNSSKKIPAFGLFYDKKPPTWEPGHIVGYSLNSTKGELYFQSKSRKSPTISAIFPYPSLISKLYLDKIPKWSELTVGKTVLFEFAPGKFQTGKIIARANSTATGRHRDGGKITVKKSKRTKTFDYRNARIKGMDVCRYFENECDAQLEDCQLTYLTNWLPSPAQYKCLCKKGFKKHSTRGCIALKSTSLPSTQTTVKKEFKTTVKVDEQLEPDKSSIRVILGSLSACLVIIIATGIVLWKNFPRRLSSEEKLRQMVIEEMEETWKEENTDVQKKTLLNKLSKHLQRCSTKLKDHFVSLIQNLREKASVYKKADSPETTIEKSSSENLRNETRNDIKEALGRKLGNGIE